MKTGCRRLLCLVLALLLVGALVPPTQAAEYEADSAEVQEEVPQFPLEEETAPAELAATGDWLTVDGIEGGEIRFDSKTGTITDCYSTVTVANIPAQINDVAVTSIGHHAFADCKTLTGVTIPDSVTSIGDGAFRGCTGLTGVTIGNGVTNIGDEVFSWCDSLTYVSIPDSVTSIGHHAFKNCTSLTGVTIPDSVTSIGDYVFLGCTGLTGVTIGNGVTEIRYETFKGCTGLTSVTIGNGVTGIGDGAFSDCTGLTGIEVAEGNQTFATQDGVLFNKEKTELIRCPEGKTGTYAIPNSVTSIGIQAFEDCKTLTGVTIGNGVTRIERRAFEGCTGLTGVTIGNGVTEIRYETFKGCTGLTGITIPNSVTSIGLGAFSDCTGLTGIEVAEGNQTFATQDGVLFNKEKTELIRCPEGKTGTYAIPNSVTSIGIQAFEDCKTLTGVTIPDSVTSIGDGAFQGCTDLAGVTIGNSVTSIGDGVFSWCDSLTYVSIPDSVTSIGVSAFSGCTSLTGVTIPEGVTRLKEATFKGCSALTHITLPDGLASIEGDPYYRFYGAFTDCSKLTGVTIPDSVTEIGDGAFYGCTGLTSVIIPDSVTKIKGSAFWQCRKLTDVYYSGNESQWIKMRIYDGNDALKGAKIHYNSTGPIIVPSGKYQFHVVDEKGKNLRGATVTWNDESRQTDAKGLATFGLLTVGEPTVTISKDGYLTWSNANSNWTQSSERYETVALCPEALGIYQLASCRYSNSAQMTFPTDLLTETKTVSLGNDMFLVGDFDFGTFYVSCGAYANSNQVVRYELWQGGKKIATETYGFFTLSTDDFADGGGCFVRVVGKNGKKVDTRINLQFKTAKRSNANSISMGGKSISFQVEDDIPFLGGSTFNANLPIQMLVTCVASEDKLRIGLNVNVAGEKSPEEQLKKARDVLLNIQKAGNLGFGTMDAQQEKIFRSLVKDSNKLEFFKSGKADVLGYLEADWGSCTATGQFMFRGKIDPVEFGYTAWIVVVPVTASIELTLEGSFIDEISYDWENAALKGTVDIDLAAKLNAFVGGGIGKLVGAGAYGSAELEGGFHLLSTDNHTGAKNIDLTGELGFKAYLGWFEYKKAFAYNTWHLYTENTVKTASLMEAGPHWQAGLFSAEDYQPQDLSYLAQESGWLGGADDRVQLFAASGAATTLTPLLEDTYRNARPTMVAGPNGLYAAFLRADASSGDVYAAVTKYNGATWAAPVRVDANAVLDASPVLCVDDSGTVWMAYHRTAAGADKTSLADYAENQSIVVGTIDPDTLAFAQKAEFPGVGYAHMPRLAVIGGMPALAWLDSPVTDDSSVLWPASATVYTAAWNGTAWSAPTVAATVDKPVTQLILGEKNGQRALAYVADGDGEATTQEDRSLYADGTLVAQQIQGLVSLAQLPGMSSADYMWNGDGYLALADGTQIPAPGISDEYAVTGSRIYYSAADGQGAHLTTALYDNGVWSEPVTLTGGERYLEDLSVVAWNGKDYLMGMDTLAEITEADVNDAKNLVWATVMPSSDLRLDGLGYPADGLVAGENVTVTLTVTNAGDHTVESIDLALGSDRWTETCQLAPGQSVDITRPVTCPTALTDYAVSVVETGWEDFTPEDNAATLSLGHARLEVTLKEQRIGTSQALVAIVTNHGIDRGSGTLRLTNEAGELLDEVELSTLAAGDSEVVIHPAQLPNGDYTATLLCGENSLYANDTDVLHVVRPCEILSVEAEEAALTADVIGEADATAYCAFYDANGRMLQVTSEALVEGLTELTFPVPGGAARGKVMLLSPEKLPLCLSKEILIP